MPCFHLNALHRGYLTDLETKKPHLIFKGKARNLCPLAHPIESLLLVPCRQCIGCRLENSRQWATRLLHEAPLHNGAIFLTLTYDPEKLPIDGSLKKAHLQAFFKRLRKRLHYACKKAKIPTPKLKYFAVGEYADPNETTPTGRPHYHAVVFGPFSVHGDDHSRTEEKPSRTGGRQFSHTLLSATWTHGRHRYSEFNFETAAYVARYCLKKVTGDLAAPHYNGRIPEFMASSNGMGKAHFEKWFTDIFPGDLVVLPGRGSFMPPPYYDRLLEKVDPDLFEKIKAKRKAAQEILTVKGYERLLLERAREGEVRTLVTEATLIRGLYK